jgi:hypothetical protein
LVEASEPVVKPLTSAEVVIPVRNDPGTVVADADDDRTQSR